MASCRRQYSTFLYLRVTIVGGSFVIITESGQQHLIKLTSVELLLDPSPLPDVVDGDESGADEEHETSCNREHERNQLPIPNHFFFPLRGRLRQHGVSLLLMMIRHRSAPVDLDGI